MNPYQMYILNIESKINKKNLPTLPNHPLSLIFFNLSITIFCGHINPCINGSIL